MAKLLLKKLRVMRNRINCGSLYFLPFTARHQKQVVALPSLNSPERSEGDGRCWANLQNTHFSGLTRKNPAFERSVLKYVSIKNRILTPSGQKSRVCVNTLDRLTHPARKKSPPAFPSHSLRAAKPARQKRPTLACWPLLAGLPEEGIGGRERRCVCVWKISA